MKKFGTEQLVFAVVLAAVLLCVILYRILFQPV
jgi:hypothetical protein